MGVDRIKAQIKNQKPNNSLGLDIPESEKHYFAGFIFHHGIGTKVNEALAFKAYLKAAKLGHSEARFETGFCFVIAPAQTGTFY